MTTTAAEIGELERLLDEIATYLTVVDEFRTAGAEPSWQPERQPSRDAKEEVSNEAVEAS
jgi:Asp-tRNA(Asn)/Glu-tRNA(Gln) amidotransferase C subunit